MKNNLFVVWGIINAIAALGVCYVLIFEERNKFTWVLLSAFFTSALVRNLFKKKMIKE